MELLSLNSRTLGGAGQCLPLLVCLASRRGLEARAGPVPVLLPLFSELQTLFCLERSRECCSALLLHARWSFSPVGWISYSSHSPLKARASEQVVQACIPPRCCGFGSHHCARGSTATKQAIVFLLVEGLMSKNSTQHTTCGAQ